MVLVGMAIGWWADHRRQVELSKESLEATFAFLRKEGYSTFADENVVWASSKIDSDDGLMLVKPK